MNMDALKDKLCKGEFSHLIISWNDNSGCNYTTVAKTFDDDPSGGSAYYADSDFVGGAEEKAKCAELNSVWTAHWYPQTPVGFCLLHASTFEKLVQGMMEVEG